VSQPVVTLLLFAGDNTARADTTAATKNGAAAQQSA